MSLSGDLSLSGDISLSGEQVGPRRLLCDFLRSDAADIASCQVCWAHYKSLARRLGWCEPQTAWNIGDGMMALPVDRDEQTPVRLWCVAWRPDGDEYLTSEQLVRDMKEIHGGDPMASS